MPLGRQEVSRTWIGNASIIALGQLWVQRLVRDVQTKWSVSLLHGKRQSLSIQHIRCMPGELFLLAVHIQRGIKRSPLPLHADPMIKTGASRIVIAHVPLADISRFVTGALKHLRKRFEFVALLAAIYVVQNAMVMRVQAC